MRTHVLGPGLEQRGRNRTKNMKVAVNRAQPLSRDARRASKVT